MSSSPSALIKRNPSRLPQPRSKGNRRSLHYPCMKLAPTPALPRSHGKTKPVRSPAPALRCRRSTHIAPPPHAPIAPASRTSGAPSTRSTQHVVPLPSAPSHRCRPRASFVPVCPTSRTTGLGFL